MHRQVFVTSQLNEVREQYQGAFDALVFERWETSSRGIRQSYMRRRLEIFAMIRNCGFTNKLSR